MAAIPLNPGVIDTAMLRKCWADGASSYPSATDWAKQAAPFILGSPAPSTTGNRSAWDEKTSLRTGPESPGLRYQIHRMRFGLDYNVAVVNLIQDAA